MQGALLHIQGHWAQFRKPETNNTPLTHDFITKTALVGLIGAVLGIDREVMRPLFPILCEDLLYGVQIRNSVKKVSWAFTLRNVHRPNDPGEKGPRQMEFIRDPNYTVALALQGKRSQDIFQRFAEAIQNNEAHYTPILGLHNCPAELEWMGHTEFDAAQGDYQTKAFALRQQFDRLSPETRINFERIPTFQDANWWNRPDGYREVIYPSHGAEVHMKGEHFLAKGGDAWCLI